METKRRCKKLGAQLKESQSEGTQILLISSKSDSFYIPSCLSLSVFSSVRLCQAFHCSVGWKLFSNTTANCINGKLDLERTVLICTVCFIKQEMNVDVPINHTSPAKCHIVVPHTFTHKPSYTLLPNLKECIYEAAMFMYCDIWLYSLIYLSSHPFLNSSFAKLLSLLL